MLHRAKPFALVSFWIFGRSDDDVDMVCVRVGRDTSEKEDCFGRSRSDESYCRRCYHETI